MANCSALEHLGGLESYISLVRNQTRFDEAALLLCQRQICFAIWGEDNPGVSGIGVSVGYIIEVALCFLLATAIPTVQALKKFLPRCRAWEKVLCVAFDVFLDCAINFALAVQLASLVLLIQRYLINRLTKGFGANDVRIATANSVLCILPLLYPLAVGTEPQEEHTGEQQPGQQQCRRCSQKEKYSTRLTLFYLIVSLFLVPFVLQCIHNWEPSRIGDSPTADGTIIASEAEWGAVMRVCFGDVRQFSNAEITAIAVFELLGSLMVIIFAIWHPVAAAFDEPSQNAVSAAIASIVRMVKGSRDRKGVKLSVALLLAPLGPAVPLLWGIFRLRDIQGKFAERMGGPYSGNEWGFGQIIGLVIFAPVFIEACSAWKHRSRPGCNSRDRSSSTHLPQTTPG